MKIAKSSMILVASAVLSLPASAQLLVGLAQHGNAQGTVGAAGASVNQTVGAGVKTDNLGRPIGSAVNATMSAEEQAQAKARADAKAAEKKSRKAARKAKSETKESAQTAAHQANDVKVSGSATSDT